MIIESLKTAEQEWNASEGSNRFEQDAIPEVWDAYKEWRMLNANAYPYNADIEQWIIEKYEIPESCFDFLGTQVYLAQQQNRRDLQNQKDSEMEQDGFTPIKWNTEYRGNVHVRAIKDNDFMSSKIEQYGKFVDAQSGGGFFIPKGRRTRGFRLQSLKGYYKAI